jgi:polysaccharide biosynthesis transport protein
MRSTDRTGALAGGTRVGLTAEPSGRSFSATGPVYPVPPKTMQQYASILLRRRWIVVAVFVVIFAGTLIYTFSRIPMYRSVAVLEIEGKKGPTQTERLAEDSPQYDDFARYLATQRKILESKPLADRFAQRLGPIGTAEFRVQPKLDRWGKAVLSRISKILAFSHDTLSDSSVVALTDERLSKIVQKRTTVKQLAQSNLLEVSFEASSPAIARELLLKYVEMYLAANLEKRREESSESRVWLEKELVAVEKKLVETEQALINFVRKHGVTSTEDGGIRTVMDVLDKNMDGLVKSRQSRARFEAMNDQGAEGQMNVLPERGESEHLKKLKEQLASLESEEAQLSSLYAPEYPKRVVAAKKIGFLRGKIRDIQQTSLTAAVDAAKREETHLKEDLESARAEALRVNALGAEYALLKKSADNNREFHKIILNEYKKMDIKARTTQNNVRLLGQPSTATGRSSPRTGFYLLLGGFLGLMGGICVAYAVENWDETVKTSEDIERNIGLQNLGLVPELSNGGGKAKVGVETPVPELVAHYQPRTPLADAIRNVHTSVFMACLEKQRRRILVTSATQGEGKTFIAVSLASVLRVQPKKKVLVVDCDLRSPRIHRVFGQDQPGAGLYDLLASDGIDPWKVIHSHPISGLFYLTSGHGHDDPFALLASEPMTKILHELHGMFDYVVIDSPPILGMPDAVVLGRQSDGVILVARQGSVDISDLREARDVLSSLEGTEILGIVLNSVDPWIYGYGHYRRYGRYYGKNAYGQRTSN